MNRLLSLRNFLAGLGGLTIVVAGGVVWRATASIVTRARSDPGRQST
ncbi:MAG: hypothetical protein IAE81_23780 [Caldilineaceae bacterium]|jgi:hypothetical protein|nr:hypothetical protein [Caldilineaceae bacterium]